MGLPGSQQRTLERMESSLTSSDPALASLFVIFGRLSHGEAMPKAEAIASRRLSFLVHAATAAKRLVLLRGIIRWPADRVKALVLVPAAMTAVVCALAITSASSPSQRAGFANRTHLRRERVVGKPCPVAARLPSFAC
jgi:hypothetical protein